METKEETREKDDKEEPAEEHKKELGYHVNRTDWSSFNQVIETSQLLHLLIPSSVLSSSVP